MLSAVKAGLKIAEVPSFELKRRAGKSNLNAYTDGRSVLRTIVQKRADRSSGTPRATQPIRLVPVELALPGTDGWRPAGSDRRRQDQRQLSHHESGYAGPERRRQDRRAELPNTVTVYRALCGPGRVSEQLSS